MRHFQDEAGTGAPMVVLDEPTRSGVPSQAFRRMKPEDTIAGCEARANSDLAQAAGMETVNGRRKFEHSAASWQQRAGLLRHLKASSLRRKILVAAKRNQHDAADLSCPGGEGADNVRI